MNSVRRWVNGAPLARQCWDLLRANPEWLKIPLFSSVGVTIVSIVFGIAGFILFGLLGAGGTNAAAAGSRSSDGTTTSSIIGVVFLFLYYLATYTIVTYSEVALVSAVLAKMRGKENSRAADGFAVANQRIGAIVTFAAMAATVGVIARMISDSGRRSKNLVIMIIAGLFAALLQGAWSIMTLMVTPVIANENLGAFPAISRSWTLFKQTWGEQIVGGFSLGLFGCGLTLIAMLPGLLIGGLGIAINNAVAMGGGFIVLVIGIAIVSLLTNAASGIFKAVLYEYATEGNTGGLLDETQVREAFAQS
jgi:hypothetical protein